MGNESTARSAVRTVTVGICDSPDKSSRPMHGPRALWVAPVGSCKILRNVFDVCKPPVFTLPIAVQLIRKYALFIYYYSVT
jgi:hypothetical protein